MPIQQQSDKIRGIWEWDIVKLILLFSVILFVCPFIYLGFNEESNRLAIAWSARVSVLLFCVAFAASSFHLIIKNSFSWWVFRNRKYWGISFAIIHLIHLFFLGMLQYFFHPVFERAAGGALFAGGMAYLFIVLMLLTSFNRFSKYLSSKQWKYLHKIGGYWIWTIFMSSYWKRVLNLSQYEYLPLAILLVLVLILRFWPKSKW